MTLEELEDQEQPTIDPALARMAIDEVKAEAARSAAAIKSRPDHDDE